MRRFYIFLLILSLYPGVILGQDKVEINTAFLEDLDRLIGIGPALAQRIIDARPFSSVGELVKVKGIGEKTLQDIKSQGLAYVSGVETTQEITLAPETIKEPSDELINTAPYPNGILINEFLPNPKGNDETDEWIEIYNSNNFSVDLSGWKIHDGAGTTKTYKIPEDTEIPANGFLVFGRSGTKIMLNNDGDKINLLAPVDSVIDSVSYTKAPLGKSYNRVSSGWQWSAGLTPGYKNIIVAGSENTGKVLSKEENFDKKGVATGSLADISQSILENQGNLEEVKSPWFLFFAVLTVAIFSAGAVLLIKIRFGRRVNAREPNA